MMADGAYHFTMSQRMKERKIHTRLGLPIKFPNWTTGAILLAGSNPPKTATTIKAPPPPAMVDRANATNPIPKSKK